MKQLPWFQALHPLNLNHLLTFMAVAEVRSFRTAAGLVHLSQSALSVQVKQLEDALGVAVLHRTTRSVTLTREGERLYAVIKPLVNEVAQVASELKGEAALQRGVVRVAVLPSLASTLLPQVIRGFNALHPGIDIRMQDVDSRRALELVRDGEVDISLMSRNMRLLDMAFEPLFQDDFLAVVPAAGHPLSARSRVRARDLAAFPLLLNPRGVDLREALERIFEADGIQVQPTQELTGTHALVSLVGLGLGVSVQPRISLYGLDLSRCRLLDFLPRSSREIGVVTLRHRSASPAIAAFRGFMASRATELGLLLQKVVA
ncbi:LysR family transcriptional regulator [Variovorax terrae]|uniref:LysR substrate-binding domain-containing protein n=1 Tax=Variovorax terrae TaxID=2923278 RepID=A0A9X1VW65_9BURK|nr:LysR family transcriptional regulator [Variovorax terrae]MCJ0764365.1 LysR substrate-binding domain-containing protein [Variovorax terrae]